MAAQDHKEPRNDVETTGHIDATRGVESSAPAQDFNRSKRFWAIIATLAIISLLSALENTVVTTALPFIATQLDLGDDYIWVTNAFFLSGYVIMIAIPCTVNLNAQDSRC